MELRHLRYFIAVAEAGSITAGAARLHVAQPAVSQRIRALEHDLGVTLLTRSRSGVVLTPAGTALLGRARDLLERADATEQLMTSYRPDAQRRVRLGAPTGLPAEVLHNLLSAYRTRYPGYEVRVVDLDTASQLTGLHQRSLDVGLVREPVRDPLIQVQPLLHEPLGIVMRADDPLATGPSVSLEQLAGRPLIWWSRETAPDFHDEIAQACAAAGFVPLVVAEAVDLVSALGRVAAGDGLHWVPEPAFRRHGSSLPDLTWRPLQGQPIVMRTSAAWLGRHAPSGATRALLALIRELALERTP